MRKLLPMFVSSLLLSATCFPQSQPNDIPKIDSDWTKKQQEAMIICDRQNQSCHESLAKLTSEPTQDSWSVLLTATILGAIVGGVVEYQAVKH